MPAHDLLPDWLPTDAWLGYIDMRKKQRKPMTARAQELRINDLAKLRDEGQDIAAVLDQSTANCWTDVYPLKERRAVPRQGTIDSSRLGRQAKVTANNALDWLEGK